jgi:ethanolamine ammonia-lyase large subunit
VPYLPFRSQQTCRPQDLLTPFGLLTHCNITGLMPEGGLGHLPSSHEGLLSMRYQCDLSGTRFDFADLRQLLAVASPARSGDELAGLGAASALERVAARLVLADVPLSRFLVEAVVPYEADEVTRLIVDSHDNTAFAPISHLTVGGLRDWLMAADAAAIVSMSRGLTPEMVAAVSKLMRNQDLIAVAAKVQVITAFRSTIGLAGRLSTRLQPNHPADDARGIAAAVFDGLLHGVGDAVIGINPASDSMAAAATLLKMLDDLRMSYEIPTQSCVLTHVTNTIALIERGAPVDLVFQSVAGSEAANRGFGINLSILREAHQAGLSLNRGSVGQNVMYFETGQGAALSANAHHGVDQQTMEARAYGVARAFDPLLVNTVVGFIGPEYLYDGKQIIRAGLEDHFCGKLLGLPMGCDVCYTNHAEADQDDMDSLMTLLTVAGCSFLICVPGGDDVMLSYQSLSYHDALYLRATLGRRAAPEFEVWLEKMGMLASDGSMRALSDAASPLVRRIAQEGGW